MEIVNKRKDNLFELLIKFLISKIENKSIVIIIIIFIVYSGFIFMIGGIAHRKGIFGEVIKPAIEENIRIPFNYARGLMTDVEKISIEMKFKNYQKIAFKREEALAKGVLIGSTDDWVPARIQWKGKDVKAEIRLKGDLSDHWERDKKWSFRIKIKGDETILGMKVFSIQHPNTRGFLNDWFLQELCVRFAGLMRLKFDFIEVVINGENLGVYCVEEFFDDMMEVNNEYLPGPIIKLDDALLWYNISPKFGFYSSHLNEIYTRSPVDAFRTGRVNRDEKLLNSFIQAKNLLEAFREGKLVTHQVFDVDKLAKLFAIMDLMGYHHTTAYSNMRFYYNPVTSLLEPIGYDETYIFNITYLEGQEKPLKLLDSGKPDYIGYPEYQIWYNTFFKDRVFFEKYIHALQEISKKEFLDEFFKNTETGYYEKLHVLYRSFPGYRFKSKPLLYENQKFINNLIDPIQGIQAYFYKYDDKSNLLYLEIGNIQSLPVEIVNLTMDNVISKSIQEKIILNPKKQFEFIDFRKYAFEVPGDIIWSEPMENKLILNYQVLGTDNVKNIPVYSWSHYDEDFIEKDFMRMSPNYGEFDFFDVNNARKSITIKPGVWRIDKNVIVPKGFIVFGTENTRLILKNNAKILSYSPFRLIGSQSKPLIIESSENSGQGIFILKAQDQSIFENVVFKNLGDLVQGRWKLSGSVTFYEAPFIMKHCQFSEDRSSNGLNIIRSTFHIENTVFNMSRNNSMSVIYGKGNILNSGFFNSNGKGIDLYGSHVGFKNLEFKNIMLSGVSANERSDIRGNDISITKANICVESIDLSNVNLNNVQISQCEKGFTSYKKRPEFGFSEIMISNLKHNGINILYAFDNNSKIIINGKQMAHIQNKD